MNNYSMSSKLSTEKELHLLQTGAVVEYIFTKKPIYDCCKRLFDIILSVCAIIVLSPVLLIVSIAIKIEDGGPVIHTRMCVGKNNQLYKMFKFRSMVVNSDKFKLTKQQEEQYRKEVKIDNDPRITKVGTFIRKTSIDELPQLFSVLFNSMSIVGPRPMVEAEAKKYGAQRDYVLMVKPGITGWWQVNGRSDCTYESGKRQTLELYYVKHRSMLLDIQIIFKTFGVVLGGKGAR